MHPFDLSMEVSTQSLFDAQALETYRAVGIRYLAVQPDFYDLPDKEIITCHQHLMALGFVIDTCHPPYGGGNRVNSVSAEDEDIRRASVEMWKHYLKRFALTGLRAVPMHTGGVMHSSGSLKARDRLTDTLEHILPEAEKSGVIVALENTFFENPCPFSDAPKPSGVTEKYINDDCAMLLRYVQLYNHPNLGICHDVGHSNLYGRDVETDLNILSTHTVLYHIHDNDGIADRHWNVGDGSFPWKILLDTLSTNQYSFPLYNEVLGAKMPDVKPLLKRPDIVASNYAQAKAALERISHASAPI